MVLPIARNKVMSTETLSFPFYLFPLIAYLLLNILRIEGESIFNNLNISNSFFK